MAYIRLENASVHFPVYGSANRSLKTTFVRAATGGFLDHRASDHVVVRALDGINLEIQHGDRVGIIGPNGSGKSTLLRVIAGSYEPTRGTVQVSGSVASMLSIWLGMDWDATGYENIFIRAAIMGAKRRDMQPLVQDITEFTELGDYLDLPLRTYSTGMAMRLAFAISTSVSADVILMDEWLSAGDESFAKKARDRLARILDDAKILVLASHQLDLIKAQCNRIVRLDHGKVTVIETIGEFQEEVSKRALAASQAV